MNWILTWQARLISSMCMLTNNRISPQPLCLQSPLAYQLPTFKSNGWNVIFCNLHIWNVHVTVIQSLDIILIIHSILCPPSIVISPIPLKPSVVSKPIHKTNVGYVQMTVHLNIYLESVGSSVPCFFVLPLPQNTITLNIRDGMWISVLGMQF